MSEIPYDSFCDFCHVPIAGPEAVPFIRYECPDFSATLFGFTFESKGWWSACAECSALVETDEIIKLVNRAYEVESKGELNPKTKVMLKMHLFKTYSMFFKLRKKEEIKA